VFRQERIGERLEKEYKEKEFEPITLGLEKVGKVIKQADKDLSKKLDLMPNKKVEYNYCGPFTKLDKRLARGDGVNKLDAACKEHDIFYRDHKDTNERHVADEKLANIANERMHACDASIGEKSSAAIVKAAMKSKVFLGMGVKY
jgi:hypothetical protein